MTYADQLAAIGRAVQTDLDAAAAALVAARADVSTTRADLAALQAKYDALTAATSGGGSGEVGVDGDATGSTPPGPDPVPSGSAAFWRAPDLSNPTTLDVSASSKSFKLDITKDYILRMPSSRIDLGTGRLSITGGRRVVIIGGELGGSGVEGTIRATGQAECLHLEGLYLSGPNLAEGIQLQAQVDAIVQLVNIRADKVTGSYAGHHADLVQWWGGGPKTLRIDGFTGSTDYQAMMMQGFTGDASTWDWRRINVRHIGTAGWTLFDAAPKLSTIGHLEDIYLEGTNTNNAVYSLKGKALPAGVHMSDAPSGDFVTHAGLDYRR